MARWDTVAWLVSESTQRDGHGVAQVVTERRMVYCNSRTVGTTAFYAAAQHGARIAAEIEVRRADYQGEPLVEYNNQALRVDRARYTADTVILTLAEDVGDHGEQ